MQQDDALPIRTPGVCVHAVVRWKSSSRCIYERRDRIIAEDDGRQQPKFRHTSGLDIPIGAEISNVARVVLPFRQHHMHGLARVFAETVTRSSAHGSRVRDGHDDLQRVEGERVMGDSSDTQGSDTQGAYAAQTRIGSWRTSAPNTL